MSVIKVVIIILFTANFGHNFPVTNKKLPSTYDEKECPPGFLPCIPEKGKNVPGPVRGSIPSPASPNTTTAIATETTAPTPSRSSNHSVTEKTRKVPPGENMEGTWVSKDGDQQERHICPPGIWVCWEGKKILSRLRFNELRGSHPNFVFLELRCILRQTVWLWDKDKENILAECSNSTLFWVQLYLFIPSSFRKTHKKEESLQIWLVTTQFTECLLFIIYLFCSSDFCWQLYLSYAIIDVTMKNRNTHANNYYKAFYLFVQL